MPVETLNVRLLNQVLAAAQAQGLGQSQLAARAGLKAETVSRAKKRDDMALDTLARLAAAAGLEVVLQPVQVKTKAKAPARGTRAPLSDPRFGLAWSNQDATEDVLLRNALIQGRFTAILESAARDGLPFVRAELARLQGTGAINERASSKAESMLASIERGFADEVAA